MTRHVVNNAVLLPTRFDPTVADQGKEKEEWSDVMQFYPDETVHLSMFSILFSFEMTMTSPDFLFAEVKVILAFMMSFLVLLYHLTS